MSATFVTEPARSIPVVHKTDVCVIGGSCTGLFAAIRAARLGARVAIVEKANCFGGMATSALVNVWHSLWDTEGRVQIIGGLTEETVDRLDRRGALKRNQPTDPSVGFFFNSEELKMELDAMAAEAGLRIFFHTWFCAPLVTEGKLEGVVIENKSGRGVIRARAFVDASGDGDLAARLGCETYQPPARQPATACARFSNWESLGGLAHDYGRALRELGDAHGLPAGFAWGTGVPGSRIFMLAGTRVMGIDPANADDLTRGEIEGRRQVRAIQAILREAAPESRVALEALPASLGIRESRHIRCAYQLTGEDVLLGKAFPDTVARGSYRVDIHHQDRPGITFRTLDGREIYQRPGYPSEESRWRPETATNPTWYEIPLRSILPRGPGNLVVAGRMLDADPQAFAATRVMVNLNQLGEAAGVAAALAAETGKAVGELPAETIRRHLIAGGSRLESSPSPETDQPM